MPGAVAVLVGAVVVIPPVASATASTEAIIAKSSIIYEEVGGSRFFVNIEDVVYLARTPQEME